MHVRGACRLNAGCGSNTLSAYCPRLSSRHLKKPLDIGELTCWHLSAVIYMGNNSGREPHLWTCRFFASRKRLFFSTLKDRISLIRAVIQLVPCKIATLSEPSGFAGLSGETQRESTLLGHEITTPRPCLESLCIPHPVSTAAGNAEESTISHRQLAVVTRAASAARDARKRKKNPTRNRRHEWGIKGNGNRRLSLTNTDEGVT